MARGSLAVLVLALSVPILAQRNPARSAAEPVQTIRVPGGGIQPQVAVDDRGFVHLVYFEGNPERGNLFFARSTDFGATFSTPVRVNRDEGIAIAIGTVRGAHLAVGRSGRVHVAWNGARPAIPNVGGGPVRVPMLYARSNEAGTVFEPERNLIQSAYGIDGGGAIAADRVGRVYVFWHAPLPGMDGEGHRRVWLARSTDEGVTFEPERPAIDEPTGACGCCSMAAVTDRREALYALFRSAKDLVNRDMFLLTSADLGHSFRSANIAPWKVNFCVMSTEHMLATPAGVLAAWETNEQVYVGLIDPDTRTLGTVRRPDGETPLRKHPVVARNGRGDVLLAWTEGMAWQKPGTLAWQVFRADGSKTTVNRVPGVPVWSFVAAFARPDGTFAVLY